MYEVASAVPTTEQEKKTYSEEPSLMDYSNIFDVEDFKQDLSDVEVEENKLYMDTEAYKSNTNFFSLVGTVKEEEQFKFSDSTKGSLIKQEVELKNDDVEIFNVSEFRTDSGEVDDIFEELLPTWNKTNGSCISSYAEKQIDKEFNTNLVDNEKAEDTNDLVLSRNNILSALLPGTMFKANTFTKKSKPRVKCKRNRKTPVIYKKYVTRGSSDKMGLDNNYKEDEPVTSKDVDENLEAEVLNDITPVDSAIFTINKNCSENGSKIVSKPLRELYVSLKRHKELGDLRLGYGKKDDIERIHNNKDADDNFESEVLDDIRPKGSINKTCSENGSEIVSTALRELYIPLIKHKTLHALRQTYCKENENEQIHNNKDAVEEGKTPPKNSDKNSKSVYLDHDYSINHNKSKKLTNKSNMVDGNKDDVTGPDLYSVPGMLVILRDYPKRMSTKNRAQLTVPKGVLDMRPSASDGLGVYALTKIPEGVCLGPYEGRTFQIGLAWRLDGGKLLDLSDDQNSNYMRYINSTSDGTENNLLAFQNNGKLYYKTCKDIDRNDQLLVYFDNVCSNDIIGSYFEPREGEIPGYHCCKRCNVGLSTKELVFKHQQQCTFPVLQLIDISLDEVFKCLSCTRIYKVYADFDRHQRRCLRKNDPFRIRDHTVKKFACGICPYTTHGKSLLLRHNLIHNKNDCPVYNCYDCDYKTYYKDNLVQHAKVIHCGMARQYLRENHVCVHCNKMYIKKDSLDDHIIGHHPEFIGTLTCKIHECPHCNYKTNKLGHMERHLSTHTKEKKHKCNVCGHKTNTQSALSRHMAVHTEYKNNVCPGCGFDFSSKYALGDHIVRHHYDDKDLLESITYNIYYCKFCNYRSIVPSDVKRHEESHRRGTI